MLYIYTYIKAAIGMKGSSQQCCPMWDLQWQKIAFRRFCMSVVSIFTTCIVVDYF